MPELTNTPLADLERIIDSRAARCDIGVEEIAPLRNALAARAARILAARHDASRSDAARAFAVEQELALAEAAIADFEGGTRRFSERAEADEARALATPKVDDARAEEIRRWASAKSAAERAAIYYRAVDEHDDETVSAFEGAPRAFGLLDDVSPDRARARKVAASPAETRDSLDAARRRIAAYEHITDAARRALRQLAGGRRSSRV